MQAVKSVGEQADEMGTTILLVVLGISKLALTLRLPIEWGPLTLKCFGWMAEFGMFQFGNIVLPDTCAYEHGPMYISSCIYILPGMMLARIKYLDYLSDRRFRDSFSKDTRYCKRQNICSVCTLILITFFAIAGMLTYYTECGVEPVDMDDDGGRRLDI